MAKRLTPEEKAQRELDKKAKREAKRLAKIAERQAQWAAEKQAAIDAFEASLTDHARAAIAEILKPDSIEQDPYRAVGVMREIYRDQFIGSLASQLKSRGFLSANQLGCIVRKYDRILEERKIAENLKPLAVGDVFETLARFERAEINARVPNYNGQGYHTELTIRFVGKDGRKFKFTTGSQQSIDSLRAAQENNEPVMLKAKVKWIAPGGIMTVLGGQGSQVRRLCE